MIPVKPHLVKRILPTAAWLCLVVTAPAQLGVVANSSKSVSAALVSASATAAIQTCAFEARTQLLFEIESRLAIAARALGALAQTALAQPEPRQKKIAAALQEVKTQEMALKLHLKAAEKANADAWPGVRAALAYGYMDYVGAVSRAEVAATDQPGD